MAKKNYVVKRSGTYGKRGAVVELDLGDDGLSDRQKIMLEEYKKPVVKVDNSKELEKVTAELTKTKAKLEQVTADLVKATAKK